MQERGGVDSTEANLTYANSDLSSFQPVSLTGKLKYEARFDL